MAPETETKLKENEVIEVETDEEILDRCVPKKYHKKVKDVQRVAEDFEKHGKKSLWETHLAPVFYVDAFIDGEIAKSNLQWAMDFPEKATEDQLKETIEIKASCDREHEITKQVKKHNEKEAKRLEALKDTITYTNLTQFALDFLTTCKKNGNPPNSITDAVVTARKTLGIIARDKTWKKEENEIV